MDIFWDLRFFCPVTFAADKTFACNNDEMDAMSSNFNTLNANFNTLNAAFTTQERRLRTSASGIYLRAGRKAKVK